MTNGSTTLAGIEIPSTDPIFLTVVAVIHIPLGIVCVVVGALAMLSKKQRGRHSTLGRVYFWSLLALFGLFHRSASSLDELGCLVPADLGGRTDEQRLDALEPPTALFGKSTARRKHPAHQHERFLALPAITGQ
jgi:hypothetical protein